LLIWRYHIEIRQLSIIPAIRTVAIALESLWESLFELFAILSNPVDRIFQALRIQISKDETFTLLTDL
jgi:hypothetical protein